MRKRRWKSRKGAAFLAFALALALGLSGTGLLDTHAAGPVETDREDCTLSVDLSDLFAQIKEDYAAAGQEIQEEAAAKEVVLNLYKAADVDVSGKYTAVSDFKDAPLEKDDGGSSTFGQELAAVDSETAAAEWEAMAAAAAGVTERLAPVGTRTASKVQTSVTFTALPVGLYLVVPQQLETPYYFYNFTPYLVSVPDNDFNPDAPAGPDNTDDWVYDVETILKWSPEVRYGDLEIIKHRDSTNGVPLKAAAFVFEVSVDPLKGEDQQHMVSVIFENDPNKTTGSVTLEACQSVFPSVTEFGMAALLPQSEISYSWDSGDVFADGMPTRTTKEREAVLQKAVPGSRALTAQDLRAGNRAARRELQVARPLRIPRARAGRSPPTRRRSARPAPKCRRGAQVPRSG